MSRTLWIMSLIHYMLFADGTVVLQQTSPLPVCPRDDVIFTCTVNPPGELLLWTDLNSNEQKIYKNNSNTNGIEIIGVFTIKLTDPGVDAIVSTATLTNVTGHEDGEERISCADNSMNPEKIGVVMISDVPSAPVDVNLSTVNLTSVLLSWSPPHTSDTNCPPATYIITITAPSLFLDPVVINTTNSTTNKTVSGLTQGLEYSFTVAGVDAGGRVGENSVPSVITLKYSSPSSSPKNGISHTSTAIVILSVVGSAFFIIITIIFILLLCYFLKLELIGFYMSKNESSSYQNQPKHHPVDVEETCEHTVCEANPMCLNAYTT